MESLVVRKCVHYVAGAAAAVSAALLGSMSFLKERGLGGVVWPLAAQQAAALTQMPGRPRLIKTLFPRCQQPNLRAILAT